MDNRCQSTFRLKELPRIDNPPKKYTGSFALLEEADGSVAAQCDVIGDVCFATTTIFDTNNNQWQIKPNRKVMPSRWLVSNPNGELVAQFDQKIMGKLFNPLYRVGLAVLDANDNEVARIVDQKSNTGDLLFGTGPNEWAILANEKCVAKTVKLDSKKPTKKGFLGKVQKFLSTSDDGINSLSDKHFFEAPVALALLLIFTKLIRLANT